MSSSPKKNKSGRNSPTTPNTLSTQDEQYKAFIPSGRKSPKPTSPQKHNKSGRNSPNKFVFTLQKSTQSNQKSKPILQPVLTKANLENNYEFIPINSHMNSPMNSPTQMLQIIEEEPQRDFIITPTNEYGYDYDTRYVYDNGYDMHLNTNTNKYFAHINIINNLKYLVFNNSALICGIFNSSQLIIDEHIKQFMKEINTYELNNNIKFTHEHINDLFVNENISYETLNRLQLQTTMDILISKDNFIKFIKGFKYYFKNNNGSKYNIKYLNKGNIKNILHKDSDLYLYNNQGNIINLYVINIIEENYAINFDINFIVLKNEKNVPLEIPIGLYTDEHLHITYNGNCNNNLNVQYTNSTIDYILNNMNMKII